MKHKTGIILAIILLSALVILLTCYFIAYLINEETWLFSWSGFSLESTNVILDETIPITDITEISLSQEFGDIHIQESPDNAIHLIAYGKDADEIDWNIANQKLSIHSKQNTRRSFWHLQKNSITLSLPSSYANKITVDANCGTCRVEDFENASFHIDCDAGNLEVGKVKNITAKCDCGNIEIEEITEKCNLTVNAGNVEITKLNIQEDSNVKVDMGNIIIQETSDIYIDAKVDLGNSNIRHNNRSSAITLTAECNCGNITISE